MSDIGRPASRDVAAFHPQQFRSTQAKLDALIAYATEVKDWPLLDEAIDAKLDEQGRFVVWWGANIRSAGNPTIVQERGQLAAADAEERTGITKQQVSRWSHSLEEPDQYREKLRQAAYRKAGLEVEESHRVNTGEYEWYTPERYILAAREVMGGIDLDPASHVAAQRTVQADHYFTAADDGLKLDWYGRVWLNPPYAQPMMQNFVRKLVSEVAGGNVSQAIMLTHNYTDTAWFHEAQAAAALLCFTRGRISFVGASGPPTQGQCFFYFGSNEQAFRDIFSSFGFVR